MSEPEDAAPPPPPVDGLSPITPSGTMLGLLADLPPPADADAGQAALPPEARPLLGAPSSARNDSESSRAFVSAKGHLIRWVPEVKKWLVWDSSPAATGWSFDNSSSVLALAREYAEENLRAETAAWMMSGERGGGVPASVKAALRMGDLARLNAMVALAPTFPGIVVSKTDIDADEWVVRTDNTLIDLHSGTARPLRPSDLVTHRLGTTYDPNATCPRWERFMVEIMCGDMELVRYLHKAVGYSLSGSMTEQVFFFLHGGGSNGKSKFLAVLDKLFGALHIAMPTEAVTESNNTPSSERVMYAFAGPRIAVGSDKIESHSKLAEGTLKNLTGGDPTQARALYGEQFTFTPQAKIWFQGNHKPRVRGTDNGLWRRLRMVPFNRRFTDEDKDPDLEDKLLAELPGILNWALAGFRLWHAEGLGMPSAIAKAVVEYRAEEDLLSQFLQDEVEHAPGHKFSVADLHRRYTMWCDEAGVNYGRLNRSTLRQRVCEHGWVNISGRKLGYFKDMRGLEEHKDLSKNADKA